MTAPPYGWGAAIGLLLALVVVFSLIGGIPW